MYSDEKIWEIIPPTEAIHPITTLIKINDYIMAINDISSSEYELQEIHSYFFVFHVYSTNGSIIESDCNAKKIIQRFIGQLIGKSEFYCFASIDFANLP